MNSANFTNSLNKALKLNLDQNIYGTFAEIGAGQEVVSYFFKAGGASGTVAKSMSAYDMIFSDEIYGKEKSGRYVCESRLEKMLNYEFNLLEERLKNSRKQARFFTLANTVTTRSFNAIGQMGHGWMGVRFQHEPGQRPSEIVIHFKLWDNTAILQQEAVGILGVNLIYAAYFHVCDDQEFISLLVEGLSRSRVEIDMIKTSGEGMCNFDNRLLNLTCVRMGLTDAVLFNEQGNIVLASDEIYKKNLLVVRGSFRPPTHVNVDMMERGVENFAQSLGVKKNEIDLITEMTLATTSDYEKIDDNKDFITRVTLINALGAKVLVTNFAQYYKLTDFFSLNKAKKLGLVLGTYNFKQIFTENYANIEGGILQALGHLFRNNVHVFLYPFREENQEDELITLENLVLGEQHQSLLDFIRQGEQISTLAGVDQKILHIYSSKVLKMIQTGQPGWEELVPEPISHLIKNQGFFV